MNMRARVGWMTVVIAVPWAFSCSRHVQPTSINDAQSLLDAGSFLEAAASFATVKADPNAASTERLDATSGYLASLACAGAPMVVDAYLDVARERDGAVAQLLWLRAVPVVEEHCKVFDALRVIAPHDRSGCDWRTHYLVGRMLESLSKASHHAAPGPATAAILGTRCEF
jgi:hypothetical protein